MWTLRATPRLRFRVRAPICFVAHVRVPVVFSNDEIIGYSVDTEMRDEEKLRVIADVGDIGQPGDRRPRASYAVYNTETNILSLVRYRYDDASRGRESEPRGLAGGIG